MASPVGNSRRAGKRRALTSCGPMKDPFKTGKMHTVPLPVNPVVPAAPEAAPSSPAISSIPSSTSPGSGGGRPSIPLSPPSSDSTWTTGEIAADRTTDPVMTVVATSGTKDRATLTIISGINAGQVFALDGTEHVIGRGTEADLWLEDGGVSRRHARVSLRSDGRYFVEDLQTPGGTFVNGDRVRDRIALRTGDEIKVGRAVLRFGERAKHAEED